MALDSDRDDVTENARENDRQPETGGERDKGKQDDGDVEFRIEQAVKAATRKANKEAETLRHRLNEIEKAEREKADAALPEIDKLNRRLADREREASEKDKSIADLRAENRRLRLDRDVDREARDKVNDIGLLMAVIDRDPDLRDLIAEDEDTGKFKGIDRAIKAALERHPTLAAQPGGPGTPPRSGAGTPPRRPLGSAGGNADPAARAREQLIQSGRYQQF